MPTGKIKNLLYDVCLPFAPSPDGQMAHAFQGEPLRCFPRYEALLKRHRVLGASLLLRQGEKQAEVFTSTVRKPVHPCGPDTLFRVASITKMATALVTLRLAEEGLLSLDQPMGDLLPLLPASPFRGASVRQVLSHTSCLRDVPAMYDALAKGDAYDAVLRTAGVTEGRPGDAFSYCNLGYGLLGCAIEGVTGQTVEAVFQERLFRPLAMQAWLDASGLDRQRIMPITRLVSRSREPDTVVTPLGSIPLTAPDPARHFGHTAGSMYTNAASLSRLLSFILGDGTWEGRRLLPAALLEEMREPHASYGRISPTLSYGLGLLMIDDPRLSSARILGHQGYAYGCADGAFCEAGTGRQVIFLNGGCSEKRAGRLGRCNADVLAYALREELPGWK